MVSIVKAYIYQIELEYRYVSPSTTIALMLGPLLKYFLTEPLSWFSNSIFVDEYLHCISTAKWLVSDSENNFGFLPTPFFKIEPMVMDLRTQLLEYKCCLWFYFRYGVENRKVVRIGSPLSIMCWGTCENLLVNFRPILNRIIHCF